MVSASTQDLLNVGGGEGGETVWPLLWLSLDSCVAPSIAWFVLYFALDSSALCLQQHSGLLEDGRHTHPEVVFLNAPSGLGTWEPLSSESRRRLSEEQAGLTQVLVPELPSLQPGIALPFKWSSYTSLKESFWGVNETM